MLETMFYGNCFTEREELSKKNCYKFFFYCHLIYKLKLIKQNVIFCSFFT